MQTQQSRINITLQDIKNKAELRYSYAKEKIKHSGVQQRQLTPENYSVEDKQILAGYHLAITVPTQYKSQLEQEIKQNIQKLNRKKKVLQCFDYLIFRKDQIIIILKMQFLDRQIGQVMIKELGQTSKQASNWIQLIQNSLLNLKFNAWRQLKIKVAKRIQQKQCSLFFCMHQALQNLNKVNRTKQANNSKSLKTYSYLIL